MAWLLDTNILSEIRKPRPEPKVVTFVSGTPSDELYVSAVTLAELRFGIDLLSHGSTQRADLSKGHFIASAIGHRVSYLLPNRLEDYNCHHSDIHNRGPLIHATNDRT